MLGWQRHIYERLSPNEPLLEFEVKRVTIALSLFSLLSSTLGSCTAASQNAQNSTQPSSSELSSVAVAVRDLGNPFFVQVGKGAEAEAKKLGGANVRTTLVSSGDDLNQQFNQIENFIASNVGMIVLNAADTKGIAPAVEKAKQAGIPIIAVDTDAEGGVDATVTSNNVQAGEVSCQYIADRLQGKGSVVIIDGPPLASVVERVQGCQSVFSKYPDLKVLSKDQNAEGSRDGGLRVMSDLLTSFPKIDAVSDSVGVQGFYRLAPRLQVHGWGVYTRAHAENSGVSSLSDGRGGVVLLNVDGGDRADIAYGAMGVSFPDVGGEGNLPGILVGLPGRVTNSKVRRERDTSYHIEAFYRFQVNDNISITPAAWVVVNPENDSGNDTQWVWLIRTGFNF